MEKFADSPSQQRIIRLLLERDFSVNDEGRVVAGSTEILGIAVPMPRGRCPGS